ncbi:hypothetical protein HELRODRAFT_190606 [Helobdella robusta]|uniref:Cupin-like domain-containing protein n=1 Tax=Helobdella robusta TaxID=6412 RepID=T1FS46_HELRO|nr:hypothetical protein HELRODRAFT_190606 [Helobdella robusta]ESO08789.1 hypothetical protein HELRODRAFT_190606 [Helobdella robusta]
MAKEKSKVKNIELDFKKRCIELYAEAERSGFDAKDFIFQKNGTFSSSNGTIRKNYSKKCLVILSFFIICVVFIVYLLLSEEELVSDLLFGYKNDQCLIPVFTSLLLPPVDCSLCRNVKSVQKLSGISREDFEKVYAYTGRPVIVTDATLNWTATKTFSYDYFSDLYLKSTSTNQSIKCQFFPYGTNFDNLTDFLSRGLGNNDNKVPWYVGWGNCDSDVSDELRQHYSKPYFLPEYSESSRLDWIFIGQPGFGAPMHLDNVGNPSWQAQIRGSKLWTLEPPYECYLECDWSVQVVVNPGEIIVLDTNVWYHGTKIVGDDISITIGSEYD